MEVDNCNLNYFNLISLRLLLRNNFILICIILSIGKSNGQSFVEYPQFATYSNFVFHNPSFSDTSSQFSFQSQYSGHIGPRKIINEQFYAVDGRLGPSNNHVLGILIYRRNQGPFINNTDVQLKWSMSLFSTTKHWLSGGFSIGAKQLFFEGSPNFSGGSDIGLDGQAGVWYQRNKSYAGVSIANLFGTKLTPLDQEFQYKQRYQLILGRNFNVSSELKYKTSALVSLDFSNNVVWGVFQELIYQSRFMLLLSMNQFEYINGGVGLHQYPVKSTLVSARITFGVPLWDVLINSQKFELLLALSRAKVTNENRERY